MLFRPGLVLHLAEHQVKGDDHPGHDKGKKNIETLDTVDHPASRKTDSAKAPSLAFSRFE
jgi:hypothetical protein